MTLKFKNPPKLGRVIPVPAFRQKNKFQSLIKQHLMNFEEQTPTPKKKRSVEKYEVTLK